MERLCQNKGNTRQILLTSDQNSHEMERRLCESGGDDISLYAECLTFRRMSDYIFSQNGGKHLAELDRGGQILLMHKAVQATSEKLDTLRKISKSPVFFEELLRVSDELKSCSIPPTRLFEVAEGLPQQKKLQEIALICDFYNHLIENIGFDPQDRLTRATKLLQKSKWAEGKSFWLDGFSYFTPQQILFLREIAKQAEGLTIVLTTVPNDKTTFAQGERSRHQILKIAQELGITPTVEEILPQFACRLPALSHLESNLYAENQQTYDNDDGEQISVFCADSTRSEVEWTAGEILKLVQEQGYRYREIAVVARDFEPYRHLVDSVYKRYNIPVFPSGVNSILDKPVLTVVTSALDIISNGYRYEDIFRYLKTGLHEIDVEDRDLLENYVLMWRISGKKWTEKDWNFHPDGYGKSLNHESEMRLDKLNQNRRLITAPLLQLVKSAKNTNAQQKAVIFYQFLVDIHLEEKIYDRQKELLLQGKKAESEEYRQLWDILCRGLEQCHLLLGDTYMELEEFAKIFQLVLSQYQVSTIPVSLDQVMAGETVRLKAHRTRCIFWLGVEDTTVPSTVKSTGLLSDEDRVALEGSEVNLCETSEELLFYELSSIYEMIALASDKLVLTYPLRKSNGDGTRPSFLVERILKLFPQLHTLKEGELQDNFRLLSTKPAIEQVMKFPQVATLLKEIEPLGAEVEGLEKADAWTRGALSPQGVESIFGSEIHLSPTKIERLKGCHFSYFMEYGLRATSRKVAKFSAMEYGTFVHHVLEKVIEKHKNHPENSRLKLDGCVSQPEIDAIIDNYVEELLLETIKSPREQFLIDRQKKGVKATVDNVLNELKVSKFSPHALELKFSHKDGDLPPIERIYNEIRLKLSGIVDRIDSWEDDEKIYLRLLDYKTGIKKFSLNDIYDGRNLQLLIYLYALKRSESLGGSETGKELEGAAISYFPTREIILNGSRTMSEEERKKEVEKELGLSGIFLNDQRVIDALEPLTDGGYHYLPLKPAKMNKEGEMVNTSGKGLVSLEEFNLLEGYVTDLLDEICDEFRTGTISADPFWQGEDDNACKYCLFTEACHFEEGRGDDQKRYSKSKTDQEVLELIKKKGSK
ncbi:MAG: PD-(D/E)XK nuclease family protein [Eubacteriales bacterium]